MKLDQPWWLLILVPLLFAFVRTRPPAVPFARALTLGLQASLRRRLSSWSVWLRPVAAIALVLALCGPRIGRATYSEVVKGIDIQLLLDVSGSMQLRDLGANRTRLDVVRGVLEEFVKGREGDRVGLLTFALYPRVACPLTRDLAAVQEALRDVRPVLGNSLEDRTAIGVAIAAAAQRLSRSDATSKVVVMLTDGEQIVHDVGLDDAADYAALRGVRLYTIAAGRAQSPWTKKLESIARATGGQAYFARDATALTRIYQEIGALETSTAEERIHTSFADAHFGFVLAAMLLLMGDVVLRRFATKAAP